jgi:dihydrofolate reductase
MDEDRGIGKEGHIPWHVSADLKRFKALTMGHPIVMGRKTWESFGRPLPGRTSIVITRQEGYAAEGAVVTGTFEEALTEAARLDQEIYVIGGAEIYRLALPFVDRIELTHVSGRHEADTFFPEFEADFREITAEEAEHDGHRLRFAQYETARKAEVREALTRFAAEHTLDAVAEDRSRRQ